MNTTPAFRTGVALCASMGALAVFSFLAALIWPGPPFALALAVGVAGAVTLAAVPAAYRGGRTGALTVIGAQVAAMLLAAGVYVDPSAPMWAVWVTTATIVVMVAGVALMLTGLRRSVVAR
ncbi:hypothetical protein [Nocardiopsis aegyptia]|uniref:FtsH-binding integral membrane protein n=1 Tax=Nocardiopsis aegyptia TaxID=220378 RepID=A0A7Z0J993_9ACTN|nr:hypothetical protein [Nocardiopsis aegyptia]NYJ33467.1 FtsH-binding integral membrane protein [Nocardiopsis aegyptia]